MKLAMNLVLHRLERAQKRRGQKAIVLQALKSHLCSLMRKIVLEIISPVESAFFQI